MFNPFWGRFPLKLLLERVPFEFHNHEKAKPCKGRSLFAGFVISALSSQQVSTWGIWGHTKNQPWDLQGAQKRWDCIKVGLPLNLPFKPLPFPSHTWKCTDPCRKTTSLLESGQRCTSTLGGRVNRPNQPFDRSMHGSDSVLVGSSKPLAFSQKRPRSETGLGMVQN